MPNEETHGRGNIRPSRLSPRTLGIREKQAEAARLFGRGLTLREIAQQLNYASAAGAYKAVRAVLKRVDSAEAETIRGAHGERISAGYRTVFAILDGEPNLPDAPRTMTEVEQEEFLRRLAGLINADRELQLKAVDRLVRLLERESRLHGIDAPVRLEAGLEGGITVVFSEALKPRTQIGT